MEPSTRLICKQCGAEFQPKNKNKVKVAFCRPSCRVAWHNGQRLKGAALLKEQKPSRQRGPSQHMQQVSRAVFQGLVPIEQRAEPIRQACVNLGITDSSTIEAALKRNGCGPSSAISHQRSAPVEICA